MSGATLDAHVDACDGGPPAQRYRPQGTHGMEPPLDEVTLHATGDPPHWHLVTRGLTELDAKESPDPTRSGWGFELTLRLPRPNGAGAAEAADPGTNGAHTDGSQTNGAPTNGAHTNGGHTERHRTWGFRTRGDQTEGGEPEWAVNLLTNLAAYAWTSGNGFAAGHHLDLGGPIRLRTATPITAAAIAGDPGLGAIDTPFGRVEFLQVVGLHAEELELCRSWSTAGVLEILARTDPLLITRLDRPSLLADPAVAREVADRAARDGASLTELRVATLRWNMHRVGGSVLTLGSGAAAALGPALRRELIGPGAAFAVISDPLVARFTVTEQAGWRVAGDTVEIDVPLAEVEGLAALFDGRTGQGRRPAWPGLRFRVVA